MNVNPVASHVSDRDGVGGRATTVTAWPRRLGAAPMALIVIGVAAQFQYQTNHDVSWYLAVARRLLDGPLTTGEYVDVNPPTISYVMSVGVALAQATGLAASTGWLLLMATLVLLSSVLSARWLEMACGDAPRAGWFGHPVMVMLAWLVACSPADDFGQRDHIIALGFMPYAFLVAARLRALNPPPMAALTTGGLVGLGLALKPQYLVVLFVLETYLLVRTRRLNPRRGEVIMAGVVSATIVCLVMIRHTDYFTLVVPLALQSYAAYNSLTSIIHPAQLVVIVAGLVAARMSSRDTVAASVVSTLVLTGLASYVTFVLQGKGWAYHYLPAKLFLYAAVGIAAWRALSTWRVAISLPRLARGVMLASLTLLAAGTWWTVDKLRAHRLGPAVELVRELEAGVRQHGQPSALLVLSTSVFPGFPLTERLGAQWASRFPCLWLMPSLASPPDGRRDELRAYLTEAVAADLSRWKPDLVLVNVSSRQQAMPRDFDLLGVLTTSPQFLDQWAHYRRVGTQSGYDFYRRAPG